MKAVRWIDLLAACTALIGCAALPGCARYRHARTPEPTCATWNNFAAPSSCPATRAGNPYAHLWSEYRGAEVEHDVYGAKWKQTHPVSCPAPAAISCVDSGTVWPRPPIAAEYEKLPPTALEASPVEPSVAPTPVPIHAPELQPTPTIIPRQPPENGSVRVAPPIPRVESPRVEASRPETKPPVAQPMLAPVQRPAPVVLDESAEPTLVGPTNETPTNETPRTPNRNLKPLPVVELAPEPATPPTLAPVPPAPRLPVNTLPALPSNASPKTSLPVNPLPKR